MSVPRPNIIWKGAHPNNFTVGRPGASRDGRSSFHHVVGTADSAALVFKQPTRNASAHFVVTDKPGIIYQCVDLKDTAWTDGNWDSNLRTISIEHHGDWRNSYDNPTVRENSAMLIAWLRENYGVNRYIRHRDISQRSTVCPADLPVEAIWNRSTAIIKENQAPIPNSRPEWLRNRVPVASAVVFAQEAGLHLYNLNTGNTPLDSRRFGLNQSFEIAGQTKVGGKEFWITKSSMDLNIPSGLAKSEVALTPYIIPSPRVQVPKPHTPDWADSLIANDRPNQKMYVLRATPLIDLENGRPVIRDGKEVWYRAGDIIDDVSTHTIINGTTYQVTEYSFGQAKAGNWRSCNGIRSDDLSIDPLSTPPGTPANPQTAPETPTDAMPDVPKPTPQSELQVKPPVVLPGNPANQSTESAFGKLLFVLLKPLLDYVVKRRQP